MIKDSEPGESCLGQSYFSSCPEGPRDGSSKGSETSAQENPVSKRLEEQGTLHVSCHSRKATTGPLENTGDRLLPI